MKLIISEFTKISNFQDLKHFIEENRSVLKKLFFLIVVIFALSFFWFFGEKNDDIITNEINSNNQYKQDENGSITSSETDVSKSSSVIYVDIGGEINQPGVYEVTQGTRLFQVIDKAGGLSSNANIDIINQAEPVYDGQKIIIGSNVKNSPYYISPSKYSGNSGTSNSSENKVDINFGDSDELQTIPGVGPSTAEKIIQYRQTYGQFTSIEEIKNVSGIGEKTFESMKKYITV